MLNLDDLPSMQYIAYGSNLHPIRLRKRTPSATLLGTASVTGMSLQFHKRGNTDFSAKCNIVSQPDSCVYVAVFDLPTAEIPTLDKAEGVGFGYERRSITIDNYGDCFTYIAAPTHIDASLKPYTWYKELVLLGCKAHGFPLAYIDYVQSIPAVHDPDPIRHTCQMQLVDDIRDGT